MIFVLIAQRTSWLSTTAPGTLLGPCLVDLSLLFLLSNSTLMGGGYISAGKQPLHAAAFRNDSAPGVWILGVLDAGYLKMVEVTITVTAQVAYAYVSGARMTDKYSHPSVLGYGPEILRFYYSNSFVCMTGGFALCTKPVSTSSDPGFGVASLEYSIQSPPSPNPTAAPTGM